MFMNLAVASSRRVICAHRPPRVTPRDGLGPTLSDMFAFATPFFFETMEHVSYKYIDGVSLDLMILDFILGIDGCSIYTIP